LPEPGQKLDLGAPRPSAGWAPAATETVACPLCGEDDPRPSPYFEAPFRVVRCGGCGLWYLSPRLTADATSSLYRRSHYYSGGEAGYADYGRQARSLRRTFRRLLAKMAALGMTGGRLLEVGTGLGYFLAEARGHFGERLGVELSPETADAAAALSGAVVHPELEAIPSDARFDCIAALHVIEHVHDPGAFVETLVRYLAPGAALVLAAPDMGSFWRRVTGRRWPSFKYPEHVCFYDAVTLARLLVDAGFESPTRLSYLHDFPLSEVLDKLHVPSPSLLDRVPVPIPSTTICFAAKRRFTAT
jgi:SAM-dependent methyltransferase